MQMEVKGVCVCVCVCVDGGGGGGWVGGARSSGCLAVAHCVLSSISFS